MRPRVSWKGPIGTRRPCVERLLRSIRTARSADGPTAPAAHQSRRCLADPAFQTSAKCQCQTQTSPSSFFDLSFFESTFFNLIVGGVSFFHLEATRSTSLDFQVAGDAWQAVCNYLALGGRRMDRRTGQSTRLGLIKQSSRWRPCAADNSSEPHQHPESLPIHLLTPGHRRVNDASTMTECQTLACHWTVSEAQTKCCDTNQTCSSLVRITSPTNISLVPSSPTSIAWRAIDRAA